MVKLKLIRKKKIKNQQQQQQHHQGGGGGWGWEVNDIKTTINF